MLEPQPNLIERTDFALGGLADAPEDAAAPQNTLLDVLNLLPDEGTGALVTRAGFTRLLEEITGDAGRYIVTLGRFRGNGNTYLIAVTTTGLAAANNVKIYAINLQTVVAARIDTAGVTWANPKKPHALVAVEEKLYGASQGNEWYSWNPDGSVWDATAAIGTWDELVDNLSPGAGEIARDFAFVGKEKVVYDGDVFTPAEGIRFKKWEDGQHYTKGERVSLKIAVGSETYWRSYRCIDGHTAVQATNRPGDGSAWADYWQKVRLPLPRNEDDETSSKWYFVPVPNGSDVAAFYSARMWVRADGVAGKDRLLFSAPMKLEKGADIADVTFNMKDFAPGNDTRGPGGGWISFSDGRSGGVIEALHPTASGLLVFKRQAVWKLVGRSEETFTPTMVAKGIGAVGPEAVAELDGLVYFLSDDGLYVTDGNVAEPVVNGELLASTLEARRDAMGINDDGREPTLTAWQDRIYISMPADDETEEHVTYVYDARVQTWWKTDLPILTATTQRYKGVPQFYFATPPTYGLDIVYKFAGTTDDTGAATAATRNIPWHLRTAWWPFGVARFERRIRRAWAVVAGAMTYTLRRYRNWNDSDTSAVSRVIAVTYPTHVEGEWFPDSHAVGFKLSSDRAPAVVHGIAVDTQPRRFKRYHRG
jgi:hypothetical protein